MTKGAEDFNTSPPSEVAPPTTVLVFQFTLDEDNNFVSLKRLSGGTNLRQI